MPRLKEFDPGEALDRAMALFWEKGYRATSIQDLVERMGINRFSIYDTFGDKRALFAAAIDLYLERRTALLLGILENPNQGLEAIEGYFRALAEAMTSPEGRRGCLVQNATLELTHGEGDLTDRLLAINRRIETAFYGALRRARRQGELREGHNLRDRARFLFAVSQGMIVMAKASDDGNGIAGAARVVLSEITSWR